jgi:hypothetical protein
MGGHRKSRKGFLLHLVLPLGSFVVYWCSRLGWSFLSSVFTFQGRQIAAFCRRESPRRVHRSLPLVSVSSHACITSDRMKPNRRYYSLFKLVSLRHSSLPSTFLATEVEVPESLSSLPYQPDYARLPPNLLPLLIFFKPSSNIVSSNASTTSRGVGQLGSDRNPSDVSCLPGPSSLLLVSMDCPCWTALAASC